MTSPAADTRDSSSDGTGSAQIGVTGLAVMGRNLARNLASRGYRVALHNRTQSRTDDLMDQFGSEGQFVPSTSMAEFVASLEKPRRIISMVQAGAGTDAVIDELIPLLDEGDVLVDGGNAHFEQTREREAKLREHGILFVGTGVSGGEEGALKGPSIMPGGDPEAYEKIGDFLEAIAARAEDGKPCCVHLGTDGAGHFVKMVHNGIEYADMQVIGEAYDLMTAAGMDAPAAAAVFEQWNTGDLDSYLIQITAEVLGTTDPTVEGAGGRPLVELITDAAEQKGTGRWTAQLGLELGAGVATIAESVFARGLSGNVEVRDAARAALTGPDRHIAVDDLGGVEQFTDALRRAVWSAKVVAYAQGIDMLQRASDTYDWDLDIEQIASIWRAGCIIRARLLERIRTAYADAASAPVSLLVEPGIAAELNENSEAWRSVVTAAVGAGVPVPGLSSGLAYVDAIRAERLPTALIQGLRDYFGAHTFHRIDSDGTFHVLWSGDKSQERQDS